VSRPAAPALEVIRAGTLTTIQEWPGRLGYWAVGVPPSGPMDDLAFRAGNRLLGNAEGAAGLEITLAGPTLRSLAPVTVAVTGAPLELTVDGRLAPMWAPVELAPGAELRLRRIRGPGMRAYLLLAGGLAAPPYLGSAATFVAGGLGRPLAGGELLARAGAGTAPRAPAVPAEWHCDGHWTLRVTLGPQGAPDPFDAGDLEALLASRWRVHHHSDRTGVRLQGPAPAWTRPDGGDAGLHPSNLHDNAYALGAVTFAGDQPLIIGPDGPSLGGFVSPACVIAADRWKLGQLRPGDEVGFEVLSLAQADDPHAARRNGRPIGGDRLLARATVAADGTAVVVQAAGERNLLVEFGPAALDLAMRIHARSLTGALEQTPGIIDRTEGIRSLQLHFDPARVSRARLLEQILAHAATLPDPRTVEIDARIVELPLSFDDPAAQLAVDRYAEAVRPDAPWCPSNLEFIRRINGLPDIEAVRRIVFEATYLVMGLGDVYLGAPVAVPLDPRHRLVTTKYTPPRTWTPENAVGIGGSYLCIYGIEGPGGYQLLGRTLPMWDRAGRSPDFEPGRPWLMRAFDQLRFVPVSSAQLEHLRTEFAAGRHQLAICPQPFRLADSERALHGAREEIDAVVRQRRRAFHAERRRWSEALPA
jgi:urea carboxylase